MSLGKVRAGVSLQPDYEFEASRFEYFRVCRSVLRQKLLSKKLSNIKPFFFRPARLPVRVCILVMMTGDGNLAPTLPPSSCLNRQNMDYALSFFHVLSHHMDQKEHDC